LKIAGEDWRVGGEICELYSPKNERPKKISSILRGRVWVEWGEGGWGDKGGVKNQKGESQREKVLGKEIETSRLES